MLSVVPIKNSSISTGYYLSQDGGYYIEDKDNKDLYTWFGKGSERLGLAGSINAKDHSKIFSGELPDGTRMGKRDPDGSFTGRPGYDLTFSANKDISLMICCTKDEKLKEDLLNLHHSAVKESMGYLEQMISARRTANGITRYETTGNMVAALCTHFNSRANDPDIHTHSLLANMTQCSDGKWRALSTDMSRQHGIFEIIRDNATLLGHIYQNKMEKGVKALGFETESIYKHGMFSIKNFPEDIKQHFSKRREQIVQIAQSLGNANELDKKIYFNITKNSRGAKDKSDTKDFIKKSQQSMDQYLELTKSDHTSFDELLGNIKSINKNIGHSDGMTINSVKLAIESLSKFSTKLSANRIIEKTFEHSKVVLDVKDIQIAITRLRDTHFITSNGSYFETQKNQFDAKRLKLSSKNLSSQISIVKQSSLAKESMDELNQLINSHEKDGRKIIVLASNKQTASDHNQYARDLQKTIWKKLSSIGKLNRAISIQSLINQREKHSITSKHTLIIDDSQRTSIHSMQAILDIVKETGAKLILSEFSQGRRSQLAGNALEIIKKTGIEVSDSHGRTINNNCIIHVKECKPEDMVNKTKQTEQAAKLNTIAKDAIIIGLDKVNVIAATKKEQQQLTQIIREHHTSEKSVLIKKHTPVYINDNTNNIKPGMIVKDYIGKRNYTFYPIKRIDRDTGVCVLGVTDTKEKRVTLDAISGKQLVKESSIEIRNGEHIKLSSSNHIARRHGLSVGKSYICNILDNGKIEFKAQEPRIKSVKIKTNQLNGLNIDYDYVKTINDVSRIRASSKEALVSVPSYGNFTPKLEDIKRTFNKALLYVSNEKMYQKYISSNSFKKENSNLNNHLTVGAVDYAIGSLSSRSSTFTLNDAVKKSLEFGSSITTPNIIKDIKEKIVSHDLAYRKDTGARIILGTKQAIENERSIIQTIKSTKGTVTSYMDKAIIDTQLNSTRLTSGQKQACSMIATTTDKFNMVQGYAGTGKSTMLKTLLDSLETSNVISSKDIIALGPTHRAVKELSDKGVTSQTVQRFIVDQKENKTSIDNKLIIIDEMSMIGTSTFKELTDLIKTTTNTKCVILGDNNQLQPVPSGAPSTLSYISKEADLNHSIMDEIKRQETSHMKATVSHIISNTVDGLEKSISVLQENNAVINKPLVENDEISYKDTAIADCAKSYASTSKEERSNTMIVTPTNKIRRAINLGVRNELLANGEISGDEVKISTFIDSGFTDTELAHSKNYKIGDIVKYANQTGVIQSIYHDTNRLIFRSEEGKMKSVSLNEKPIIEKYTTENIVIQKGDSLKWTKTDYERNVLAHSQLSVIDVKAKDQIITVKTEKGKVHDIDLKLSQNKHLSYAYASTIYGSQGATVKHVMAIFDSESKRANSINAMYVALTRATHSASATLYTQDTKQLVQSIAYQKSEEQIALKAFGMLDIKGQKDTTHHRSHALKETITYPKKDRLDAVEIKKSLSEQAEHVCKSLFGDPNKKLSNSQNWRYGTKGALSIFVGGDRQGSFMNFETGEGGDLIKLIMSELGLDFKSALEHGSRLVGHVPTVIEPKISQPAVSKKQPISSKIDPEKYDRMQKLVDRSMPIKGSVAEKYLKSRGIEPGKLDDIRVLKRVNTGFKNNEIRPFASALLGISRDEKGQMSAIQMTYLDPMSGQKIGDLPIKKRSMGALKGSVVELKSTQEEPKFCFAAEGIETALSIKNGLEALKKDHATVVATLGISNFSHLDKATKAQNIILILDNDGVGAQSQKMIDKAILKLQEAGKRVLTMKPEMLEGQKTDYNDLLKAGKMDQIKADIECTIDQKEIDSGRGNSTSYVQIKGNKAAEIVKNPSDDREIFG